MLPFLSKKNPTSLLEILEVYLIREGLRDALPEDRRALYLLPVHWLWAGTLMLTGLMVALLARASFSQVAATTILPLGIFLLALPLIKWIDFWAPPRRRGGLIRLFLISTSLASGLLISTILGKRIWFFCMCSSPSFITFSFAKVYQIG